MPKKPRKTQRPRAAQHPFKSADTTVQRVLDHIFTPRLPRAHRVRACAQLAASHPDIAGPVIQEFLNRNKDGLLSKHLIRLDGLLMRIGATRAPESENAEARKDRRQLNRYYKELLTNQPLRVHARAIQKRQLHVLERRRAREEIEALKDEPDQPVPQQRALVSIEAGDVASVEKVLAGKNPGNRAAELVQCAPALDRITAPVLLVGGWHDLFIEQTLEQYRALGSGGRPAKDPSSRSKIGAFGTRWRRCVPTSMQARS